MARPHRSLHVARAGARRALAPALALAVGCGVHTTRSAVEPPRSGTVVVFRLADEPSARCRVELGRMPAATFTLATATLAREADRAGDIRAVAVELEGERPVLTVQLSPTGVAESAHGTTDQFCGWARSFLVEAENASQRLAPEIATATLWPLELDVGRVHFRSVQRLSRGGEPSGFAEYWMGMRPDGTRVLGSRSAVLSRRGDGWRPSDTIHVEETDTRGMLQRGRYVRFGDGLEYRVELRRTGERTFGYSGFAKGKQLDGSFEAPGGLATMLVRVELFRERAGSGPAEPVRLETYAPGLDATRSTPVVHRRDPARPHGIRTQLGSREAAGVVDRDGILVWLEETGDQPARYETISRSGVP